MMKAFHLTVSTPSGKAYENNVIFLGLKGTEGSLGILADHIPFTTTVLPCKCRIKIDNSSELEAEISEGLLTVSKELTSLLVNSFTII